MIAFLCVWLLAIAISSQPPSSITPLDPEPAIDRPIARGEEHLYQLTLARGEYVHVVVEQRGVDVIVQTRRGDGAAIADFQEEIRRQGQEDVELVADADGPYTLAVRRAIGPLDSGS